MAGLALLTLSSCAAPRGSVISIAAPEEQFQRMLDHLAGDGAERIKGDREAEESLESMVYRGKHPRRCAGVMHLEIRIIEIRESEDFDRPGLPRIDYGLYANPIP